MHTEGMKRLVRLLHIIRLFRQPNKGYRVRELADKLGVDGDTIGKDLVDLSSSRLLAIERKDGVWTLMEDAVAPELELSLSYPEAVGLYLAGRLLSQTQDEPNWHISMALQKLVEALPASLKERQQELLELLMYTEREGAEPLRDLSSIFYALASGWAGQRRVRLSYAPPSGKNFTCDFDPYLLEPSAIGRTIYAIGHSSLVNDIHVYKLERIRQAELTNTPFQVSEKFKGLEMLKHAWGVMYNDEKTVAVRVRFSANVTPRVRETRWHPSQDIKLTRTGCEWLATIGDTLEIEPWLRGWGADCEVLEPLALREQMVKHLRQAIALYGLGETTPTHQPGKLDRTLFKKKEG